MLAVTALALLKLRNLFAVAMLAGIYSLLSAGLFVALDAVDVAFTEAAVGAGISTILVLGTLALVGHEQKKSTRSSVLPLVVVLVTGSILVYGTHERRHLHRFGALGEIREQPAAAGRSQ